ncbi:Gfo/Idh/MocA family protein [Salibacterium qingdaonense]|uniref:Predicted dehydrogenase n=1 Tax=Salibacterium qingdaonense TaxID=266892 RepID=A0A1I4N3Y2_9BACI|nr:Gfo/Idh/MocA family oxidoreductase [Salibacterium qingdaonense]SFM10284.1 Predicted dehydrogenase [Salibacterium qingdaonense]
MKDVRWGIIGCGDVTEKKSGPAFQTTADSSLAAVMRRNGDLARDYAERHGVPVWYDKAEDLIQDENVNAVYIATPPGFHKEYTMMAAEAGKPVYVEKPMARSTRECEEMAAFCAEKQVPLYVAYYRRTLPRFLKVKELLDAGAIGEVRFVTMQHTQPIAEKDENGEWPWRLQPEVSGGGLFFDLASHTLDLFDYLLGPVRDVTGFARNQAGAYPVEDTVSGAFLFENGAAGTGIWNFSSYKKEDVNRIVGTKGEIIFSSFDEKPVTLMTGTETKDYIIEQPQPIQRYLIQAVVEELTGKGTTAPSTGETALRTNRVMDELVKGFYGNNP